MQERAWNAGGTVGPVLTFLSTRAGDRSWRRRKKSITTNLPHHLKDFRFYFVGNKVPGDSKCSDVIIRIKFQKHHCVDSEEDEQGVLLARGRQFGKLLQWSWQEMMRL